MGENKKKKWSEDFAEKMMEDEGFKEAIKESYQEHGMVPDDELMEAIKEGIQEGAEEGLKEGIQEGIKEGIQEGILEGVQEGLKEAFQEFGEKSCSSCGKSIPSSNKFCTYCGSEQEIKEEALLSSEDSKSCSSCGKLIPRSNKFCTYCGVKQ